MYSEVRQDEFVVHMMNGKIGEYLEIGAWKPIDRNNTYLLEQLGWEGISLDISNDHADEWRATRKNTLIVADARSYQYPEKDHIDYLQLDVEPPSQTFAVLERLMKLKTTYSIITYETDAYGDPTYVKPSRELLTSKGYILAVPDVLCGQGPFEDWYINPNFVDINLLKTWNR
jgi:hypothetical protein